MRVSSLPCQDKRAQSPGTAGCDWGKVGPGNVGTESDGFGTKYLEANTEFRHSAFSCAVLAVRPFEVMEGMEGKHTPERDN